MQASFGSTCPACEDRIYAGDEIRRSNVHSAYVHEGCYDADAEQDEEEAMELPTRKRPGGLAARVRIELETGKKVSAAEAREHAARAEKADMMKRPHVFAVWRHEEQPDCSGHDTLLGLYKSEESAHRALLKCSTGRFTTFSIKLHEVLS